MILYGKEDYIEPTDEDLRALALDATMNDTVKMSRIRPLGAAEVEAIFRKAGKTSFGK